MGQLEMAWEALAAREGETAPERLSIAERFARFDAANPDVYRLFCQFALRVLESGHTRYSADALLHQIRWHTEVETKGDGRKINNVFAAEYARKLAGSDARFAEFFEMRKRTSTPRGPSETM